MYIMRFGILISLLISFSAQSESLFSKSSKVSTYVGYSFGIGDGEEKLGYDDEEEKYDYDLYIHRFSVGFISEKNHRFELSYSRHQLDFGSEYDIDDVRAFDIDGVISLYSGWVVPYVTAGLGFTTYRGTGDDIEGGSDLDGFAFNYGIGFLVSLYKTVELDVSYRGSSISWESLYQGDQSEANRITLQNNQTTPMLGIHIIF